MFVWIFIVAIFSPMPAVAAPQHIPSVVVLCVDDLNVQYNTSVTTMPVQLYSKKFIDCFLSAGAANILPSNSGDTVQDVSGAACVVAAERDFVNSEEGTVMAEKTFTTTMNACYKQFPPFSGATTTDYGVTGQFTDVYDETAPLTTEESLKLADCLRPFVVDSTSSPTADQNRQIAACFTASARPNVAQSYENMATIIDCARDATSIVGLSNITSLTKKQQAYYEKCVTTKVIVPITTGAAIVAVPLASGFGNILLYFQFLFTQPALFFARRKGNRGKVVDSLTAVPLDLSTVRLLRLPERTVVKTIVTGASGDYIFVPPPGDYALDAVRRDYSFPSQYNDGYHGESLSIATSDQVVNNSVPLDRKEINISVRRFLLAKWRRRFGTVLAWGAPTVSIIGAVLTPKWWTIALCIVQFLLLALFYRLSRGSHIRVFGIVKDEQGKTLSGVVVSLFDKKYNKLLYYSVTDLFGRYTLPEAFGVFAISFIKPGYTSFQRDFTLSDTLASADVMLTKKANLQI